MPAGIHHRHASHFENKISLTHRIIIHIVFSRKKILITKNINSLYVSIIYNLI